VRRQMGSGCRCEIRGDDLPLCLDGDALGDALVVEALGREERDMLLLLKDGQLLVR
jgi:hypothetical protein